MGVCTQGFGHKNSEARLFWMVSWALYREKKKTSGYGDLTSKNTNGNILFLIQEIKKYCLWFGKQSGVVFIQKSTE